MVYIILSLILILLIFAFIFYGNNHIDVTKYDITTEKKVNNTKIIHLSDFHSKVDKRILEIVKKEKPDIIAITGDYINDKYKNAEKMLTYAKELVKTAPVVYVTGNHERRLDNFDELMDKLRNCGFNVLLDSTVDIKNISFLGLDENQANFEDYTARKNGTFQYKDVSVLLSEFCKQGNYKVVLSHFPENFELISEMNYSQYDFDLQLSGHAHGGQWILPFIGPVFSPGQGLKPKYAKGIHGDKTKMIVSRGIGNAEFPIRIFNHPEIIIININK